MAIDEAIERGKSLRLVHWSICVEMAMHISAVDLEFSSNYSILSLPYVFVGNASVSVITNKQNE